MPRRLSVCLYLVVVLGAAGCGADPKVGSLPALPSSSLGAGGAGPAGSAGPAAPGTPGVTAVSPSPTVPAVPPVVKPPEADQPDAAGAEAFARYWMAELNAAYSALDAKQLLSLSDPGCQSCSNYAHSISEAARLGQRYVGGQSVVTQVLFEPATPDATMVLVDYTAQPVSRLSGTGEVLERRDAVTKLVVEFRLVRAGSGWRLAEATRVQ